MEKVWCGARGKAMKGANTLLAQDGQSNAILYTHADILRKNEAKAVQQFSSSFPIGRILKAKLLKHWCLIVS